MKKKSLDLSIRSLRHIAINNNLRDHWRIKMLSVKMIIFSVFLFAFANSVNAATVATSEFSSGADGWTWGAPNPSMSWQLTDGNPGGYIRYDNNQGGDCGIYAPSTYMGNWGNLGVNELSYEVNIFTTGSVYLVGHYQASISGPGGEASWLGPQPDPTTPWKNIIIPISEASWTVNSGSWNAIMADVTNLRIEMAYYNNWGPFEITGIDNVSLSAVPIPGAVWLLGTGLVGLVAARRKKRA